MITARVAAPTSELQERVYPAIHAATISALSRRGCGSLPSRNPTSLVTTAITVVITIGISHWLPSRPHIGYHQDLTGGTRPAVYNR